MSSRAYTHGWFAPMEDDSADIRRWLLPRLDELPLGSRTVARATASTTGATSTTSSSGSARSAPARPGSWPPRGHSVVGLEQFELGHSRGASHDTSRILRHSYHTPAYVRLTREAYDDWARLEAESGESLVTVVGGLDLFPPDCVIRPDDYVASLREVGIEFEELDVEEIRRRWPQFHPPAGTLGLFQERGAIVPAARGTAAMQRLASAAGATLIGSTPGHPADRPRHARRRRGRGHDVHLSRGRRRRRRLDQPGARRARGRDPADRDPGAADLLRAARPRGVPRPAAVDLDGRAVVLRVPLLRRGHGQGRAGLRRAGRRPRPRARRSPTRRCASGWRRSWARCCPASGPAVRSLRCQYTLTPDRDFVLAPVPGHPSVVVGLGSAHGFKFAPTFGRILADLVTTGETSSDVSAFGFDRPGPHRPGVRGELDGVRPPRAVVGGVRGTGRLSPRHGSRCIPSRRRRRPAANATSARSPRP